jgi:prophage DNA circulation protein
MAFTLDNVSEASFAGAKFLVETNSVTGGRKNVVHEFVNSNRQVIEDLGRKKRTYNISAIITGENYEREKRKLISRLESKDVGVLIHPFFGTIERIKPLDYSLTESFSEFGVAKFNIKFSISDAISTPTKAKNTATESKEKRDASVAKAKEDLKEKWKVAESIDSAVDKVKKLADKFEKSVENATREPTERIDELNAKINNFKGKAAEVAQDVDKLSSEVDELFYNMESAFDTAKQNFDSFKDMFGFGDDDDEELQIETTKQNEINNNNNALNSVIEAYALNFAYTSYLVTDTTNSTIEEIEFEENILEQQYDNVFLNSFQNKSLNLETINSLTDSRSTFNTVIKDIKTTVPDIEQVEILNSLPLRAIEFKYYGRTDRFKILKSINENPNIEFYEGQVNLLNDNP